MADNRILSRRGFLGATAGSLVAATAVAAAPGEASAASEQVNGVSAAGTTGADGDLILTNGKFHTFDAQDTVVSQVLIRDGKFAQVGSQGWVRQVIDVGGRTVIPGMIDNHCHFIRIGQAAGYDMRRLETAFTIAEVQQVIANYAAEIPAGQWLTALRGLALRQWSNPPRHLTRAELDAAAPNHPVVLSEGANGQTNTLGRDRLRALGVTVSDAGSVNDDDAYLALSQFITLETRKRELLRAAEYAVSVGLTGFIDEHGNVGTPGTAGFLDRTTGHDHILALWRDGELPVRVRARFGVLPPTDDSSLLQIYAANRWQMMGDDMFRQAGIGEWVPRGSDYQASLLTLARRGLLYQQHLISTSEIQEHLDQIQQFVQNNPQYPVAGLHWSAGHVDGITQAQVIQANNLGVGLIPQGWSYLTGTGQGPNFRMILDNATVPVGTGTDAARVSPLNPWAMVYYMTTGRNSAGVQVNAGRTISRAEALRLYCGPQQGWFSKEEQTWGGIAIGRYADLTVLANDVFDQAKVSDDQLRKMTSVLTIVNGAIQHTSGGIQV